MVRQPDQKSTTTGKHIGASERVMGYMRDNANIELPYSDVQKALGLPRFTVINSINHLISRGVPLVKPTAGVVCFRPTPNNRQTTQPPQSPSRTVYEFVGFSKGRSIVRGEDDELYVLTPLFDGDA